ncbi:MAG: phosphoribosylanthranilate isomerase [Bacillota bacterium]
MWVKICGISTMKAAVAAVEAGADAVGFVFAPSRRQVSPDRAQALVMGLPPETVTVGVFVDAPLEEMRRVAAYVGLKVIQMHGSEPPEYIEQVGLPVIKAFRIKGPEDLAQLPLYRQAAGLLLDPYVPGQHGGTGQTLDWTLVRWAAQTLRNAGVELSGPDEPLTPGRPKLILAGGLTVQNVDEAIRQAEPGGVDVSSGVETNGEKDNSKIYDFVDMVKGAGA